MVRVPISNQDRLSFVKLSMKPAAKADKQSLVNQHKHKVDFSLYKDKRIPVYVLAGKDGFSIHRYDKSSFVFLNQDVKKRKGRVNFFFECET